MPSQLDELRLRWPDHSFSVYAYAGQDVTVEWIEPDGACYSIAKPTLKECLDFLIGEPVKPWPDLPFFT